MWSGNVKTALANLRSSKTRSLLTMLGIIIGVSSVITVVSLGEGLKQRLVGQIRQIDPAVVIIRPGKLVDTAGTDKMNLNLLALLSPTTLTENDVGALAKIPSVSTVVPLNFATNSLASDGRQLNNISVLGTTPSLTKVLDQKVERGAFFSEENEGEKLAVIGSDIAKQLFDGTNPIAHSISIKGESFIVRGVLAPSPGGLLSIAQTDFNSVVYIPFNEAKKISGGQTNILQILAGVRDGQNIDVAVLDVKQTLLNSHGNQDDFTVLKQRELLKLANDTVGSAAGFITAIAAISLLVAGIGIMDIMLVSVSERTREIGIRKAVGATNRQILNQFLVEGMALSVGGGIIGITMALLIYFGLRLYTRLEPVLTAPIMILAVVVSVVVGVIFSVAPALKAARKDPIVALRGE
ncbi:ABC transporter permease [Candidatus Saccharibacteria bacterium]|nr:ABC transporter permease [Candidatus Saccharibacteria bacterium]